MLHPPQPTSSTTQMPPTQHAALIHWRTQVLDTLLYSTLAVGGLAVILAIINALAVTPARALALAGVYLGFYAVLAGIALVRRLGFMLRALAFLALLYGLGVFGLLTSGLSGDGRVFLFALTSASAILFGRPGGGAALALAVVTLAVSAWLVTSARVVIPLAEQLNSGELTAWATGTVIFVLLTLLIIITMTYLLRQLTQTLHTAEQSAQQASAREHDVAQQAAVLREQTARLEQTERALRALVDTLEVVVVPLADGILLAPLLGTLDERRMSKLTTRLLHEVAARRTRTLILDIAGVKQADAPTAQALLQTARALRLLGCTVALTGIAPAAALTFTRLGLTFDDLTIAHSPQQIIAAT